MKTNDNFPKGAKVTKEIKFLARQTTKCKMGTGDSPNDNLVKKKYESQY